MTTDTEPEATGAAHLSLEPSSPPPRTQAELDRKCTWCFINMGCCIWSFLLVIDILSTHDPDYEIEGTQEYLVWSFGTTAIWCFEIFSNIQAAKYKITYEHVIEGVLAVYFLMESIFLLGTWTNPQADFVGELAEAALTTVGYAYLAWHTSDFYGPVRREEDAIEDSNEADISTELDRDGAVPYQLV